MSEVIEVVWTKEVAFHFLEEEDDVVVNRRECVATVLVEGQVVKPILRADPNDSYEGESPEYTVTEVVDEDGEDILANLSEAEIGEIIDIAIKEYED